MFVRTVRPKAHADDDPGPELLEFVRQVRAVPARRWHNSWTSSDADKRIEHRGYIEQHGDDMPDPRLDVAAGLIESPEAREIDAEERGCQHEERRGTRGVDR